MPAICDQIDSKPQIARIYTDEKIGREPGVAFSTQMGLRRRASGSRQRRKVSGDLEFGLCHEILRLPLLLRAITLTKWIPNLSQKSDPNQP